MRISIASIGVLAALVLPLTAAAKQITSLKICGAGACRAVVDAHALRVWLDGGFEERWGYPRGPYYRLTLGWGEGTRTIGTTRTIWLPRAGLIRHWGMPNGSWWRISAAQQALLTKASHGIAPAGHRTRTAAIPAQHSTEGGSGLYAGLAVAGLTGLAAFAAMRTQTRRRRGS